MRRGNGRRWSVQAAEKIFGWVSAHSGVWRSLIRCEGNKNTLNNNFVS